MQGLISPEKQSVIDVYLGALRGVFLVAMAEMILAAAISLVVKNNLLKDDPKQQTDGIEMEKQTHH